MAVEKSTEGKIQTPEILFPKECQSLPLVCQEGVRNLLTLRMEIARDGSRYIPRTPDELNTLIPQIQKHAQEYVRLIKPFRMLRSPHDTIRGAAERVGRGSAFEAARTTPLRFEFDVVEEEAQRELRLKGVVFDGDATEDTAGEVDWYAGWAAAWETLKDQPGFEENPYLPLFELYKLGAARIQFHEVDNQEKLVVDLPLKLGERLVFGSLVFGEDNGDKEVLYYHESPEEYYDASQLKPLNPPQLLRIIR